MSKVRITPAVEAVLRAFLTDPQQDRYGYDLMRDTKQSSGKLYPILRRLTDADVLERLAPVPNPESPAAPPHVPYRLDPKSVAGVRQALAELDAARRANRRSRLPVLSPRPAVGP